MLNTFIKKMESENLDFLPVEDAILVKKEYPGSKAKKSYVFCCEESLLEEFDISWDIETQLEEIRSLYTDIEIGDSYSHFAEFTQEISPAYTIADLKKILTK